MSFRTRAKTPPFLLSATQRQTTKGGVGWAGGWLGKRRKSFLVGRRTRARGVSGRCGWVVPSGFLADIPVGKRDIFNLRMERNWQKRNREVEKIGKRPLSRQKAKDSCRMVVGRWAICVSWISGPALFFSNNHEETSDPAERMEQFSKMSGQGNDAHIGGFGETFAAAV